MRGSFRAACCIAGSAGRSPQEQVVIGWLSVLTAHAEEQGAPPEQASMCAPCHGLDGDSAQGMWPKLSGQPAAYVSKQLWDFKLGARVDPTMTGIAAGLEAPAIAALADWFSSREPTAPKSPGTPAAIALGQKLFQEGDRARGLAPCRSCHGAGAGGGTDARGNAFPALASQHATYTTRQLTAFASGERDNDAGGMMRWIASKLTAADIDALAVYLAQIPRETNEVAP